MYANPKGPPKKGTNCTCPDAAGQGRVRRRTASDPRDVGESVRIETRSADQEPVHAGAVEKLRGVRRSDRAAVQKAQLRARREELPEGLARRGGVGGRRCLSRPDRPY